MKRCKILALMAFSIISLLCFPLIMVGATIDVGPGQTYNGTSQATINQAINAASSGDTVYLHAATYNITSPIFVKSGITLRGDGNNTVIHAAGDNVCNSETETGSSYVIGLDVSNVTICYLRFTSTANDKNDGGHGDGRNCIEFRRASGCTVHNVTFTRWLWNDAVRIRGSSNMTVHDCQINAAHDGVSFFRTKGGRVYNNNISVQINNGVRTDGAENIEIDHNTFTSTPALGGWCCVQIQNEARNINIHNNIFHDTAGKTGIAPYSFSGSNVSVHDNVFWNCAKPIDVGSSSNNIMNPTDQNVSNWVAQGFGCGAGSAGGSSGFDQIPNGNSGNSGNSGSSGSSSNKIIKLPIATKNVFSQIGVTNLNSSLQNIKNGNIFEAYKNSVKSVSSSIKQVLGTSQLKVTKKVNIKLKVSYTNNLQKQLKAVDSKIDDLSLSNAATGIKTSVNNTLINIKEKLPSTNYKLSNLKNIFE